MDEELQTIKEILEKNVPKSLTQRIVSQSICNCLSTVVKTHKFGINCQEEFNVFKDVFYKIIDSLDDFDSFVKTLTLKEKRLLIISLGGTLDQVNSEITDGELYSELMKTDAYLLERAIRLLNISIPENIL